MTAYAKSSASYRESAILTATPERLVVMLYDGAHRFLVQATAALEEGRLAEAGERLGRATAIVDELQFTLDMEAGEVANRLQGIYVFCRRHLAEGLSERDTLKIAQVDELLCSLRDSWAELSVMQAKASAA